jgi:hypothetical protein
MRVCSGAGSLKVYTRPRSGPHFWSPTGPLSDLTVAVTSATDPTCGSLAVNQRLDTPEAVVFLTRFTP